MMEVSESTREPTQQRMGKQMQKPRGNVNTGMRKKVSPVKVITVGEMVATQ